MTNSKESGTAFWQDNRTVAAARQKIDQDPAIRDVEKQQILAFLSDLAIEELKKTTIIGYAESLRVLAKIGPASGFLYLQRRDVQQILIALKEKGYAIATLNGMKQRLLRFQRWLRIEQGYPQERQEILREDRRIAVHG